MANMAQAYDLAFLTWDLTIGCLQSFKNYCTQNIWNSTPFWIGLFYVLLYVFPFFLTPEDIVLAC